MKLMLNILSVVLVLICSCTKRDDQQASTSGIFSVQIKETVTKVNSIKKVLTVTFKGSKLIRVGHSFSGYTQLVASPAAGSGTKQASATVILSARLTVTEDKNTNMLSYEYNISTSGGSGGGPTSGNVPADKLLCDLVEYSVKEGKYSIGQGIPLGQVEGRKITLYVEDVPN
ncbi:MAG: hypothetical protein ACYSTT_00605 [Planctomycetota bacterium]